jgi:hypothetical protein
VHDRALAEDEHYRKYNQYLNDNEEEGRQVDALAMKRRRERIEMKSDYLKRAFNENGYIKLVQKFDRGFDEAMRELLQLLTQGKRYETHIANLSTRLDYNAYYSEYFNDLDM